MNDVILGDCLVEMRRFSNQSIDLIITDPPYGIKAGRVLAPDYKDGKYGAATRTDYGSSNWDDFTPTKEYFDEMLRISKKQVIFGGQYFTDKLPPRGKWIIWDKKTSDIYGNYFSDCELAWTSENGASRIIRYLWNGMLQQNMKDKDVRVHPTQKPVSVMRRLIQMFSKEGELILDPFAGSGTTLRAAKDLNRRFIGFEIESKYVDLAKRRLAQETLF